MSSWCFIRWISLCGRELLLWILENRFHRRLLNRNRAVLISAHLQSGIHWGHLKLSVGHSGLICRLNWYQIIQIWFVIWRFKCHIDLQIDQLKWRKSISGNLMPLQISSCFTNFVFDHFYSPLECWSISSRGAQGATLLNIAHSYPFCKHFL